MKTRGKRETEKRVRGDVDGKRERRRVDTSGEYRSRRKGRKVKG